MKNLPEVTIDQARSALSAAITARVTLCFVGAPGVGKTATLDALHATLAENLKSDPTGPTRVISMIGSDLDPTDVGGLPMVSGGKFTRIPTEEIRAACDEPVVLFIDEFTTIPQLTQAPMLRMINERRVAGRTLHPGTVIALACNPPEQAPGAFDLSAAMVGRITLMRFVPSFSEVQGYFATRLGADGTTLKSEAVDFAATVAVEPNLLQMDPPAASIASGEPWGAPRSWERALRGFAAAADAKADEDTQAAFIGGAVGTNATDLFLAIRKLRKDLPTVAEIAADPEGAKCPEDKERQVAAVGLIARVAEADAWAAWIYAGRLHAEARTACARTLVTKLPKGASKWKAKGEKARVTMLAAASKGE